MNTPTAAPPGAVLVGEQNPATEPLDADHAYLGYQWHGYGTPERPFLHWPGLYPPEKHWRDNSALFFQEPEPEWSDYHYLCDLEAAEVLINHPDWTDEDIEHDYGKDSDMCSRGDIAKFLRKACDHPDPLIKARAVALMMQL